MQYLLDIIARLKSVAITGTVKNAGKTECLNFIIRGLEKRNIKPSVTSIGVDGENIDSVKKTHKPEIFLSPGDVFVTTEGYYKTRELSSEIMDVSSGKTSLGRLITSRVITPGKVIVSGPADTKGLRKVIDRLEGNGFTPVLVDGALSRLSLGAPTVTDAMVLATGAALSSSESELVKKTAFVCEMIDLPLAAPELISEFENVERGVWPYSVNDGKIDLNIPSALELRSHTAKITEILEKGHKVLFISGVVTDSIIEILSGIQGSENIDLVIRDFTCMFVKPLTFHMFWKRGGKIQVLKKPRLLGICVNPVSPSGFKLDSKRLCDKISYETGYTVVDVVSGISVRPDESVKNQKRLQCV